MKNIWREILIKILDHIISYHINKNNGKVKNYFLLIFKIINKYFIDNG